MCLISAKKKERLRSKYKASQDPKDYTKYQNCRRNLKKVIREKMRSNFEDENDTSLITKNSGLMLNLPQIAQESQKLFHIMAGSEATPRIRGNFLISSSLNNFLIQVNIILISISKMTLGQNSRYQHLAL